MDLSRPKRSSWRKLVLMVSLMACGICQASSQIFIIPFTGIEGYKSYLHIENVPEDVQEYSWHRGANDSTENMIASYKPPSDSWQSGPMSNGRQNVTRRGILVIKNSMLNDTGNYTIRVDLGNETQTATGWLEIQEWESDPGISVNATFVVENMDPVAAFCHTNATSATKIKWYVNAFPVSSNDRMTISPDHKTLIIHQVNRYDRTLQCAVENILEFLQRSEIIFLTVAYGPDRVTLSSQPYGFNSVLSAEIGSKVLMECSATSLPKPKYRWIHNGSLLSSEANISLPSLTWEQMGSYRCIAENPTAQLTMYRDVRIQRPRKIYVGRTDFYISGPLVVFLIVMTVLGSVYICGMLVYILITHFSTRTNQAI